MEFSIYQVDAFSEETFGGNPAAIVPLDEWINDELMQKIAMENNLSETAFFVPTDKGYHLRWFTPSTEVPLCGHATLASAHVLYSELGYDKEDITFETLSGELNVVKKDDGYVLNFPAYQSEEIDIPEGLIDALGFKPSKFLNDANSIFALVVVDDEETVRNADPDHASLMTIEPGNFIVTSTAKDYDFISRVFVPEHGVPEDPVTGSAHCVSAPYWVKQLGKSELSARQVSARGGDVFCTLKGDRLDMFGKAKLYLKGTIYI